MTRIRNKKIFLAGLFLGLFFGGLILTGAVVLAQPDLGLQPVQEGLGLPDTDIRLIVARIIRIFLGLLGIIALVLMLYAGYEWMTAGGNEEKIAQSKKILTNAVIGLAIILSSYAIVSFVMTRLLSATTGYPEHCFNGSIDFDEGESGRDCGGPCPSCGDGGCVNPPCGISNVFFVENLPSGGDVCVRNVRLAIMFSESIDITTVNSETVSVRKKDDNSIVNGSWQYGGDRNVALFVPNGSCSPYEGNDCLLPTTTYVLDIINSKAVDIKNLSGNRSLNCSLKAKCDPVEFTTGEGVDRNPPTVSLDVISPFQSGLVMPARINFTDDNGLQNISLYAGNFYVGSERMSGCQKSGVVTIDWNTSGLLGNIPVRGVGLDWAANRAEDTENVILRPEHCFNHNQDNPGSYILNESQYETGVDCGGSDCGVCAGDRCANNSECASGYCENPPGVCVDKMRITDVSPLSGAAGTFVTVAGNYFGSTTGKIYFARTSSPNVSNINLTEWQQAELANCGTARTWTPWQIVAMVPNSNVVTGPIMVETASTTGKDGVERKFFDTTNDGWGRIIDNFSLTSQIRPGLCPIVPDNGLPNDSVVLSGKNFGTAGGQVFFGSQQSSVQSWADLLINTKVPYLDRGSVGVFVRRGGLDSNGVYFYVKNTAGANDPVISGISPNFGARGEYITITGDRFGSNRGTVLFLKDGSSPTVVGSFDFPGECDSAVWGEKQIIVKFPSSTTHLNGNYNIQIRTNDNRLSVVGPVFNLTSGFPAPGICRIDPVSGPVPFAIGGTMSVYGEYFKKEITKSCSNRLEECSQNADCLINPATNERFACNDLADPVLITSTIYLWDNSASSTSIVNRILVNNADVRSDNLIVFYPVGNFKTGPVAAYRPSDQKLGNGVSFTVNDCVKNNNTCTQVGYQCCASGADQGICRPEGELCAGQIRSTGYVWRFSTRDIPAPLRVFENCNETTEAGRALPSPSPSTIWNRVGFPNDHHVSVCRTALLEIEFSRGGVRPISNSDLIVVKCDPTTVNLESRFCVPTSTITVADSKTDSTTEFTPTPSVQLGSDSGREYIELKPQVGQWEDNSWYRVILKNSISAATNGITTTLIGSRPCDIDGNPSTTGDQAAYCFFFRTGSEDCRLRTVVITPYSYWTSFLEAPLKHRSLGTESDLYYSGHGLSEQRCIMMDVSGFDWNWSSSNSEYSNIYSGTNTISRVQVSSLRNTVGVGLTNPNNAVNINALVTTNTKSYTGRSPLTIDLSNPKVVEYWPNCLEACTNAEIGVRFNITMSNSNLSHLDENGPARLYRCNDENCLSKDLVSLLSLSLDETKSYAVLRITPSTTLEAQKIYQVEISNEHTPLPGNPGQYSDTLWSASEYRNPSSFSKPLNEKFVWRFRTKKEVCRIDRIEVLPKIFNARNLFDRNIYSAQPFSSPDSCDPNGQKLNAYNVDWTWQSSSSSIATTSQFISVGYNQFCTSNCVRKGSDVPAGVVNRNLRVCGNGIVEAGEDCDPPGANLGCGLNCLRTGNNNTTTTASGVDLGLCGDGFVSSTRGEKCDPGSVNESERIGCTSNCLRSGSRLSTGATDISASICGNGYVGAGEDCDLGIDADPTSPTSSVGCSANCLHTGTRLSTGWCFFNTTTMGGFTTSSYQTYCATAYSQCGDGVANPDEDPGCDGSGGWASSTCNTYCLKKPNQGSCGAGEGCVSGNYKGSSLLYSTPSVCGDRIAGIGEDPWCENNLVINRPDGFVNPWALAIGVGEGVPTGNPLAQRANIIASTQTNTSGGVKSGSGEFLIKCGYQSDSECVNPGGYSSNYGVARNSCCYERPQLTAIYPGVTTTQKTGATPVAAIDTCPNTYISANFNKEIDVSTLSGNFLIARGVSGSSCSDGMENVTNLVNGLSYNQNLKWYEKIWNGMVRFLKNFIGVEAQANPTGINVQTWCAGKDLGTAQVIPDTYGSGSKIKVDLRKPLEFNTDYIIILKSDIKDVRGVKIESTNNIFWRFSTGDAICELTDVSIVPDQYYFSKAGATTTLEAIAESKDKKLIQPIPGFYSWEMIWGPQINNFVELINTSSSVNVATAKNQNGEIDVRASANVVDNQYTAQRGIVATGDSHIIVFLCERPWPPKDLIINSQNTIIFPYEDKIGNNDDFSINSNTFTGLPIAPSTAVNPGYFNFSTYYCADNGNVGSYDDLPYLKPAVQVGGNIVSVTSSMKRFLFTNERNSDAVGIQIFPNTEHLSPRQWFLNSRDFGGQGFTGNLQDLKIDGYDAVTDGNNIYVSALDISSSDPNPTNGNLYNNIYLFSINADAKQETRNVFEQMVKNLKFNTNLTNYGYCGASVINPGFSNICNTDLDCPEGEVCSVQAEKIKRDYKRVRDLGIIEKLFNNLYSREQQYPTLSEGTYLNGQTLSTWPSWSVLGSAVGSGLPSDPVNKLAPSGSCSTSTGIYCINDTNCPTGESCVLHDAITGWSTTDRRFSFACSSSSLAYRYIYSTSTDYLVRTKLENNSLTINNWSNVFNLFVSSTSRFSTNGICLPSETITTMQAGRCGDGKLNLNLNEVCDPPGFREYEAGCTAPGGLKYIYTCNSDCQGLTTSTVSCESLSVCGNGKIEQGETCDEGVLNGTYNHCDKPGQNPAQPLGCRSFGYTGFCGDGRLQPQYEFCDTVSQPDSSLLCTFASSTGVASLQKEPILYFLIDLSGSMNSGFGGGGFTKTRIQYVKEQMPNVASALSGKAKIGLATFSSPGDNPRHLGDSYSMAVNFYNSDQVSTTVNQYVVANGGTHTGPAIKWVSDNVFANLSATDKTRPISFILVTDGDETAGVNPPALEMITRLRNQGILTYVLGVAFSSANFSVWAEAGGTNDYISINNPNVNLADAVLSIYNDRACRTYSVSRNQSCKYDCSGLGGYCGDGLVDQRFEQCETNQTCSVDGVSGNRVCSGCVKKDGKAITFWKFDELISGLGQKTYSDEQGNWFINCTSNCPVTMEGKYGRAIVMNGTNNVLTTSATVFNTNRFTYSFWVNPNQSPANFNAGILERASGYSNVYFSLRYKPDTSKSNNEQSVWLTFNNTVHATSTVSVPYDKWTHLALSYDGVTAKLFVDGNLNKSVPISLATSTLPINIGRSYLNGGNSFFFGKIDEFAFYNQALSEGEIKDIYTNNWLCAASTTPVVTPTTSQKICGDGIIDKPNDAGLVEDCDNGSSQNGVECSVGYNKSCSYCSADCSATIFRSADGYCGDGIINGPESCDYLPANPNTIFSKNLVFGKTATVTSTLGGVNRKGYLVNSCLAEKNFKLNLITIASTANWDNLLLQYPSSSSTMTSILNGLRTYREGTKSCINDCMVLQDNCTECGLSSSGSEIKGALINVLEPNTVSSSKYRTPLYYEDWGEHGWDIDTLDLFYTDTLSASRGMNEYGVARQYVNANYSNLNFTFNEFALRPHDASSTSPILAVVNTNPLCSATTSAINDYRYILDFNASRQTKQAVMLEVVSSPAPWQYDQVLSPIIRKTVPYTPASTDKTTPDGKKDNTNISVRPRDIRIVVRWIGDGSVYGGFMTADASSSAMFDGNSFATKTTGIHYYDFISSQNKKNSVWYHGFSTVQSKTNVEAFTVDLSTMITSKYAFYVRTAEGTNMRSFLSNRLQVEVYVPEDETIVRDDSWRHFSRPAKIYYLNNALPSDNQAAGYWHVFNINRLTTGAATLSQIQESFTPAGGVETQISRFRTSEIRFSY